MNVRITVGGLMMVLPILGLAYVAAIIDTTPVNIFYFLMYLIMTTPVVVRGYSMLAENNHTEDDEE